MALNSSGPISLGGATVGQSVNLELGNAATALADINSAPFRGLAGVPSGAISLSNFYGKSSGTYYFAAIYNMVGTNSTISIDTSDNYYYSANGPGNYPAVLRTNSVGTVSWSKYGAGPSSGDQGGWVLGQSQVWTFNGGQYKRAFDAVTGNGAGNTRNLNTHSNSVGMCVGFPNLSGYVAVCDNEVNYGCCGTFLFYGVSYIYNGDSNLQKNVWRDCVGTQGFSFSIVMDSSSNIYTCGYQQYNCGQQRGMLVKMDSSLSATWVRLYGYTTGSCYFRGLGINASGDLAVNFQRNSSSLNLVKYNSSGTLQWANSLTGTATALSSGAAIDSSGNCYYLSRWRRANGTDDTMLVKYNSAGTLQWQRILSCKISGSDVTMSPSGKNSLAIDSTGALVLALTYFTSPTKGFIAKLPNDGSKTGTYSLTDSNGNALSLTYAAGTATNATASGYVSGSATWPSTSSSTATANFGSNSTTTFTSGYTQVVI